jgi:hypothetical protein
MATYEGWLDARIITTVFPHSPKPPFRNQISLSILHYTVLLCSDPIYLWAEVVLAGGRNIFVLNRSVTALYCGEPKQIRQWLRDHANQKPVNKGPFKY